MDSRWIPYLLAAGWLLILFGLWGALGCRWWIWPLGIGGALCALGGAYAWAFWRQLRSAAKPPAVAPDEVKP